MGIAPQFVSIPGCSRSTYERLRLRHGSLLCREMECRYESDREELAVTPFRRESLRQCSSLFSSDQQSQAGLCASVPEIFPEPIRSCIYRECNPGRADL